FSSIVSHGFVSVSYGRKMSKSLGNFVTVGQYIDTVGADALRLKLLSAASVEHDFAWIEDGLQGWNKFVERIWKTCHPQSDFQIRATGKTTSTVDAAAGKTIDEVTEALSSHRINRALGAVRRLWETIGKSGTTQYAMETLLLLLYLFA